MQQFPYGIGTTYPEQVETIVSFIRDKLLPYVIGLNTDNQELIDVLNAALEAQTASVMAQLQVILAQIIAGENVNLNDGSILAALQSTNSLSLALIRQQGGVIPLAGVGIDLTGATDSTTAVQAFFAALLDGDNVVIPPRATILLSDTIAITKRIRLSGNGVLKWNGGISAKDALAVSADGAIIDSINMLSIGNAPLPTGDKQSGIAIYSSNVKVLHCRLDGFQQAIAEQPFGECYNALIDGNTIINVPGSGGGRGAASSVGEDRGDGIVMWGAGSAAVNNYVSLKPGDDGRIGIHTEGLSNLEGTHGPHSSSMNLISNNRVMGQFRRGIAVEGVVGCVVEGNTVADATWWGIGITGGDGCSIVGNTVIWTSTTADNQGAAFSPRRAAFSLYGGGARTVFADNVLTVIAGAVLAFGMNIETNGVGTRSDVIIHHNVLIDDQNSMYSGINANGGAGEIINLTIDNNDIKGYIHGAIETYNCNFPIFTNNRLTGPTGNTALGIVADGNPSGCRADMNTLISHSTALKLVSRTSVTSAVTAKGNVIIAANIGIDYSSTPSIAADIDTMIGVTTPTKSA